MASRRAIFIAIIVTSIALASCRASAEAVTPTTEPIFALATPTAITATATSTPLATPLPSATPSSEPFPDPVEFSHAGGDYDSPLTVTLNISDVSGQIRYTIDGADPVSGAALIYSEPLTLFESTTIRAIAIYPERGPSNETASEYTLRQPKLDAPSISHPGGAFAETQTVTIDTNEPDATIIYTLDGSTPTTDNGSAYTGPVIIDSHTTLKATVTRPGFLDSDIRESTFRIFGNIVESDEDIILGAGDRLVIEDTLFIHRGDIRLSGDARLVIKNSMIRHLQDFAFEHSLEAVDQSSISIESSGIGTDCNGSFNWSFVDQTSLIVNGMDPKHAGCNTWNFMSGESEISASGWDTFSGTVCDSSTVYVANAETLEVELCFPEDSTVNTSLPSEVDQFNFGPDPANNIGFALTLQNVVVDGWGINVLPGSEITIYDSAAVTIGIIVGTPWQNEMVTLTGLERRQYEDQFWQIGPDAALRLINTTVYGWEPNVFADNTLIIGDSDYTASAVNGGSGRYEIYDSVVNLLSTNENVTMTVIGSVISGDVIANGDSVITLIGCIVEGTDNGDDGRSGGNVFARDNGRVVLRDTTVIGDTVTQDNGEIVVEENG